MEWLGVLLPIGAVLVNLFVGWVAWSIRGMARNELRRVTDDIYGRLGEHDSRLTELGGRLRGQPTHEDLALIHARVSDVKDKVYEIAGDLKGTHADVGGLKRSMDILVKHHLREGKE